MTLDCHGIVGPHPVRVANRYWMGPQARPVFVCYACADALRRTGVSMVPADRRAELRPPWTESELRFAWGDR